MNEKVSYVLASKQTRNHSCHWPGCPRQVPPAMWGCKEHWYKLPKHIRNAIWQSYQPEQENDLSPSRSYVEAARLAREWIIQNYER